MAESFVNVTEGSGKKLHAWDKTVGANTVLDEFTLPGEYPLASYIIRILNISIATANDHVLAIQAGSSLNLRLRRIHFEQGSNATAATVSEFRLIRLSTAGSGGTSVTPNPFDPSDSASGCTAQTLPSTKGTETTTLFSTRVAMRQTIATAGTQIDDAFDWYQLPNTKPIMVASGTSNGICLKIITATAGATVDGWVELVESNF